MPVLTGKHTLKEYHGPGFTTSGADHADFLVRRRNSPVQGHALTLPDERTKWTLHLDLVSHDKLVEADRHLAAFWELVIWEVEPMRYTSV